MPFLGPWFLMGVLGLAGAAIPIVLHLFFRSRYRTVPWAAMEFLLTSIEQTSRRLKFQELLLLILRCALLLLLALALARPAMSLIGKGGRDVIDAVFVVDNSYSMGAREGAKNRFELAKTAALAALDQLPPHSSVQIVTCGTMASEPLVREPGNLDLARKVIEKLELTHQATDLSKGLARAVAILETSKAATKELYLFSDMQKQGLSQNANEIKAQVDTAKQLGTVYFVRCGSRPLANATIVEAVPQTGIPRPGQRVGFAVEVRNTGELPVRQLQVGLAVDGAIESAETQTIPELAKGDKRVVALTARFDKPGLRVVTAFLGNDDMPGDNYLDRVIEVRHKVKVLVVDGNLNLREPDRSSSYYLVNALNALTPTSEPVRKGDAFLQTDVISPRQAGGELLKEKAICILVNVPLAAEQFDHPDAPTKEFTDALANFVKKGGGLMIFGGDKVNHDAYNKTLGISGLLPVPLTPAEVFTLEQKIALDRTSTRAPGFDHFRTDESYKNTGSSLVFKTLGLDEPGQAAKGASDAAEIIFRYTNKKPAIVARNVGFGEVIVVGAAADFGGYKPRSLDPVWSDLPLWNGYLPVVEAMINRLLQRQSQNHNSTVGETLRYAPPPDIALRPFMLLEPADRASAKGTLLPEGQQLPLGLAKAEKEQDRPLLVIPGLLRGGVYKVGLRDGDGTERTPFAMAPDLRESADLQTLDDGSIDRQLGFAPVHITAKEEQTAQFAAERTNREWTTSILWLVLIVAVGESLLAWFCGRAW